MNGAKRKGDVSALLTEWSHGNAEALDKLMPLVYGELRRLAKRYLRRERPDHTLQSVALIHEAYFRLINQDGIEWNNRNHFFAVAAQAMRRVLVDHARTRRSAKRGGDDLKVSLAEAVETPGQREVDVLALDEALDRLGTADARKSRVVELRYFGGFTIEETAEVLGISTATVKEDWNMAKAWLYRELAK
jgi:RNA polymerase sigma factor (TIGR02999 family)